MTKAFATSLPTGSVAAQSAAAIELICHADTLVQLRAAIDNGADWVELQFSPRSRPSANCPDINMEAIASGVRYAHDRRCKVVIRMDRQWEGLSWACRRTLVDKVAAHAVDAIGLSDQALMFYTAANYPQLQLHYIAENIVDALSAERLKRQLNVSRVALPQLLSMTELIRISRDTTAELQLYGFCRFSSVIDAAKLQAAAMENRATKTESRQPDGEGFSDQCATPECAANDGCFNDHCAADIKVLRLLPQLNALGIRAIRIDAAGSRPIHTAHVTRIWREAIDECAENTDRYVVRPSWIAELNNAVRRLQSH